MLALIEKSWGWTGLQPSEMVSTNPFGNVIVRDHNNAYWRITPEEWTCEIVANSAAEWEVLREEEDFLDDWNMEGLVEIAEKKLGPLAEGRCYCLKLPAIVGGEYNRKNLGTIAIEELIAFAGDMAFQIKDLPDGSPIEFTFVE